MLGEVGDGGGAGLGGSSAEVIGLEDPGDGRLVADDAGVRRAVPEVAADVERGRLRAAAPCAIEGALVLRIARVEDLAVRVYKKIYAQAHWSCACQGEKFRIHGLQEKNICAAPEVAADIEHGWLRVAAP